MQEPIKLTVLIDPNSDECLYIEGNAWEARGEPTVYVSDLVEAAEDKPIILIQIAINRIFKAWPKTLKDALELDNSHNSA